MKRSNRSSAQPRVEAMIALRMCRSLSLVTSSSCTRISLPAIVVFLRSDSGRLLQLRARPPWRNGSGQACDANELAAAFQTNLPDVRLASEVERLRRGTHDLPFRDRADVVG